MRNLEKNRKNVQNIVFDIRGHFEISVFEISRVDLQFYCILPKVQLHMSKYSM